MSHPVSITDLLTAIGSDNIKFQYLATCMEGIKGAKGRNLITFGTDALTPSDVALNAGPSGLIIWVEGDLMRQSLGDIKSGNSLTFGKVVEQRDELLAALNDLTECYFETTGGELSTPRLAHHLAVYRDAINLVTKHKGCAS